MTMPDREKVIGTLKEIKTQTAKIGLDSAVIAHTFIDKIIALLKEQEAVEPILEQDSMVCGVCGHEVIWQKMLGDGVWLDEQLGYCPKCGKQVKWNDRT